MERLTAEIIKNQMIGQTAGHMASIPNNPILFSMFEVFCNVSMQKKDTNYTLDEAFKKFIEELNDALDIVVEKGLFDE
jgi:hypothetical protein